jgi:AbrB family looped-hinge helix DNA binding protein
LNALGNINKIVLSPFSLPFFPRFPIKILLNHRGTGIFYIPQSANTHVYSFLIGSSCGIVISLFYLEEFHIFFYCFTSMVSFSKEVKIMLQAKLSSKFQLSIPKALRCDLNLQAGQQFTLIARGKIIELIPVRSITSAKGMLAPCEPQDSSEYRDRTERDV